MNEVTFTLGEADLKAYFAYVRKHHPSHKRMRVCTLVFFLIISSFHAAGAPPTLPYRVGFFFASMTILLLASAVFGFIFIQISHFRMFRAADSIGLLCEHKITISPQKLIETTTVNETHTAWSGIHKLVATPDYFYFFMTSLNAHVIPKKAFTSQAEADEFFSAAERYQQAAKSPLSTD